MIAGPLFQAKLHLLQWISKLPTSFETHWVKQYQVIFTDLVGIVNATVHKTKPIFTDLGNGKLSSFLTPSYDMWEVRLGPGVKMKIKVYSCVVVSCVRRKYRTVYGSTMKSLFAMYMHHLEILHIHDDVIKWKHFPRYWPCVRGIHRSPVNSPHKGQWRGALVFSLICALNKLSKQSSGWWFEITSRPL